MATTLSDITEDRLNAAWQEVIQENNHPQLAPGEKTINMFAKEAGLSISHAGRILRANERFTRRPIIINGRRAWAYCPILTKK